MCAISSSTANGAHTPRTIRAWFFAWSRESRPRACRGAGRHGERLVRGVAHHLVLSSRHAAASTRCGIRSREAGAPARHRRLAHAELAVGEHPRHRVGVRDQFAESSLPSAASAPGGCRQLLVRLYVTAGVGDERDASSPSSSPAGAWREGVEVDDRRAVESGQAKGGVEGANAARRLTPPRGGGAAARVPSRHRRERARSRREAVVHRRRGLSAQLPSDRGLKRRASRLRGSASREATSPASC